MIFARWHHQFFVYITVKPAELHCPWAVKFTVIKPVFVQLSLILLRCSHEVSPTALQRGSAVYNISDWLSDVISGLTLRDASLLYASDRKLFNITSLSGSIWLNNDPPLSGGVYSLAVLVNYESDSLLVSPVCLKMAAEDVIKPAPLLTSDHHEITVQVYMLCSSML